jgi:hypothetical protein
MATLESTKEKSQMRKTLLFATVLLLCAGAVQAQVTRYELVTVPEESARKGGLKETGGTVFLNTTGGSNPSVTTESIMFHFSAPLATDTPEYNGFLAGRSVVTVTEKDTADNDGNGTIAATSIVETELTASIRGLLFDVSEASAPVTVTITAVANASTDANVFITIYEGPTTANVITDIALGVKAEAKSSRVNSRGTGATGVKATLTIEEGFKGAFMHGNTLELEIDGLPNEVKVGVVSDKLAAVDGDEADSTASPPVDDASTPTAMLSAGSVTGDEDGDDKIIFIDLGDDRPSDDGETNGKQVPSKFELTLTLTADSGVEDSKVSFPLDISSISARVTFSGSSDFEDAFTSAATIFEIRHAQCTMVFPVVTVMPDMGWDTAISITNPGYGVPTADGELRLTFYGNDQDPVMVFPTMGTGLPEDGSGILPAGNVYQALVSEILKESNWGDSFQGHVHVLADYPGCTGVGWVTDWMGVNQAYNAVVINSDTGKD